MQFLCAFLRSVMARFPGTHSAPDAKIISIVIHVMHIIVVMR